MNKFVFPLDRVMNWRGAKARVEELRLENLRAELHGIDARIADIRDARARSEETLLTAASATGAELSAIDAFGRFSASERARLDRLHTECFKRVDDQARVAAAKRRDFRLLERLKQQRLSAWKSEFSKEIDAQAEESHLAKWNVRR